MQKTTQKRLAGKDKHTMEVDFNPGRSANMGTSQPVVRRERVSPAKKTMSFDQTQALERTLKATPQVRPAKVAQAVALAADASYPSDAQLSRLAGLLAPQIGDQET